MSSSKLFAAIFLIFAVLWMTPAFGQSPDTTFWVANNQVNAIVKSGSTIYIGGDFTQIGPPTGAGVPLSTITAAPIYPFPKVAGQVRTVASDGAGGWFIGGEFTAVGGQPRQNLAHILVDGTVSAWNPGADRSVADIELSGSTLYVGGSFVTLGGVARNYLGAVDAITGTATAWNPSPTGDFPTSIYCLTVSGSTVYVGGAFTSVGGQLRNRIAALSTAGVGNATIWNPNASSTVQAIKVVGSTVYVGGGVFTSIGSQPRNGIAALDATSGLATTWNPSATAGSVVDIEVDGSTIYVCGSFTNVGGQNRSHIAALDATSGLATLWNPAADGILVDELKVVGNTVYAGGVFSTIGGQPRYYLAAVDATTGLATAWNPNANSYVFALEASGNTLFVGGLLSSVGAVVRNRVAAIDALTGHPTSWDPNANGTVLTLAMAGGHVFAGGDFTQIGGLTRSYLAMLDPVTGAGSAAVAAVNANVRALATSGNLVYVGGQFTGVNSNRLIALNATTGAATGWHGNVTNGWVEAIGVQGNTVYAGGFFSNIGGQNRAYLAAVDATTGFATNWNPHAGDIVYSILPAFNSIYVAGDFFSMGGQTRMYFAALDNSGAATSFDPSADNASRLVATNGTDILVGGFFGYVGGQNQSGVGVVSPSTGEARPWNLNVSDQAQGFAICADGPTLYVGGFFWSIHGEPQSHFAAFKNFPTTAVLPPAEGSSLALAPLTHPVRSKTKIEFTVRSNDRVTLAIYDVSGRRVQSLLNGVPVSPGKHEATFDARGLASGYYYVRLSSEREGVNGKLLVLR